MRLKQPAVFLSIRFHANRSMNKDQRFFDMPFEQVQQFIAGTPIED